MQEGGGGVTAWHKADFQVDKDYRKSYKNNKFASHTSFAMRLNLSSLCQWPTSSHPEAPSLPN